MTHEVREPLRLKNGKFMRGDVEVPPEIGNTEQIALLREAEREAEELERAAQNGTLDVDISVKNIEYEKECRFTCICGKEIIETESCETDDVSELEWADFDGEVIICSKCGRKYKIWEDTAEIVGRINGSERK